MNSIANCIYATSAGVRFHAGSRPLAASTALGAAVRPAGGVFFDVAEQLVHDHRHGAFPLAAPEEDISLVSGEGLELAWLESLVGLSPATACISASRTWVRWTSARSGRWNAFSETIAGLALANLLLRP